MSRLRRWWQGHPRLISWLGLSLAMVVVFLVSSRGVALEGGQRAAMVVATITLAGVCVWIIFWD